MTISISPLPTEIETVAGPVNTRLGEFLDQQHRDWEQLDVDAGPALDAVRRLVMAGGKRLRPAFAYWSFIGAGGDPGDPRVIDAGAAFELLHAFALIHDDVMDGSETRRGEPTVHVEFSRRHRDAHLRGEARRFGEGVAILAGDLAAVMADQLMAGMPRGTIDLWHRLQIEVNIGQYLDVVGTARGSVDLDDARRISQLKSGRYTVVRPLHVGASLAGGSGELLDALSAYGEPLGEAFQMRDDLLGVFGDPSATGKPVADDLREGKPTPLLAVARARATGTEREVLARVGAPDLSPEELDAIVALLESTGARSAVESSIGSLCDTAIGALGGIPLRPHGRSALETLARYVAYRDR